jgi:hypothetical protein
MEKAYSKLHGNYEILNGGSMAEGLVDLTGGTSDKYNFKSPEVIESIANETFWKDIKKHF